MRLCPDANSRRRTGNRASARAIGNETAQVYVNNCLALAGYQSMIGNNAELLKILWPDRERQFKLIQPKSQTKLQVESDRGCFVPMRFKPYPSALPPGCLLSQSLAIAICWSRCKPDRRERILPARFAHKNLGIEMHAFDRGLNKYDRLAATGANSAGSEKRPGSQDKPARLARAQPPAVRSFPASYPRGRTQC